MNEEEFLRRTGRLLPRRVRQAVLRDLREMFQAAEEAGESEEEVLEPAEACKDKFCRLVLACLKQIG